MPLYELEEGTSRKFYRIELHGNRVHLNWGRIGTEGEHQVLAHENEVAARAEYQRQLDKRLERGYRLVVDEGVPHDREALEKARLAATGTLSNSPRFLFVHHKRKRFAWVEARDATIVFAKGAAADEATTEPTTKPCASPAAAIRERDTLVAQWMAKGYELVTFGKKETPKKRTPKPLVFDEALERAIAENPYDDAAWSVLEDWVLQQEDVRGDLVRFAKANQRADEAQTRGAAMPQLFGQRHSAIWGALAHVKWRCGHVIECQYTEPARNPHGVSECFYAAPATRLLRSLDLHVTQLSRFARQMEYLRIAPCRHVLRRLTVSPTKDTNHAFIQHLDQLERLELLYLHAPMTLLRSPPPPKLRELTLGVGSAECLASWLVDRHYPALTQLVLRIGYRPSARTIVDELAPLLAGTATPVLAKAFIFVAADFVEPLRAAVAASPLAEVVTVSQG